MRIRLLAVFLTVIFLPVSFGLAQTTASLDSIPAHAQRDRRQRSSRRGHGGRDAWNPTLFSFDTEAKLF